jgi:hypothetical protein
MRDQVSLRRLGTALGVAAWVCITYALFAVSEGQSAGMLLPALGIALTAAAVLCFVRARRLGALQRRQGSEGNIGLP